MPEEINDQEVSEQNDIETESASEVEAKEEPKVPLRVVQELREQLKELKEDKRTQSSQIAALMSQIGEATKRQSESDVPVDPEILKLLDPYLRPLKEHNSKLERELESFKTSQKQAEAERYIERNLPNLKEIREDIIKELETYSAEEQAEIYADPKQIVRIGKMITRIKSGSTSAREVSRSRARAESGTTNTRPDNSTPDLDTWAQKWMKDQGLA